MTENERLKLIDEEWDHFKYNCQDRIEDLDGLQHVIICDDATGEKKAYKDYTVEDHQWLRDHTQKQLVNAVLTLAFEVRLIRKGLK